MDICEQCGSHNIVFAGYEYWEDDDNGEAIILETLITDNPDLTPESKLWTCNDCGVRFCELIKSDGSAA